MNLQNPTWTAGARSAAVLAGDGWFSFRVPVGVLGASVGLGERDESTEPDEPPHRFFFEAGRVSAFEGPRRVWGPERLEAGQVFSLVRVNNRLLYCRRAGGGQQVDPGSGLVMPGEILAEAAQPPRPYSRLLLDAALLGGGDQVVDAELHELADRAALRFAPLAASGADHAAASAAIALQPMTATGNLGGGVRAALPPLTVRAFDREWAGVQASFPPMVVTAQERTLSNGASVWLGRPTVEAGDYQAGKYAAVRIGLAPPQAVAWEVAGAAAHAVLYTPQVFSWATGAPLPGSWWGISLPAVVGGAVNPVDPVEPADPDTLVSTAIASDEALTDSLALLTSSAVAGGEVIASADTGALLHSGAAASDRIWVGGSGDVESVALTDDWIGAQASLLLQSTALAGDWLEVSAEGRETLESAARASDAAVPISVQDMTGEALASDGVSVHAVAFLESVAVAEGSTDQARVTRGPALLESAAVATEEILATSDRLALLESAAVAEDEALVKQPGCVAWVLQPQTGAASWYDNWHFTSMAQVGGRIFAAGPQGLVQLGGETDGGDAIDAAVQWGFLEFGGFDDRGAPRADASRKRITSMVFGYHASGPLQVSVETYGQGYGTYRYSMPAKAAQQPTNNRVLVGRGLSSRYWRIGVGNTQGCDFEVHAAEADVVPSMRRI